MVDLTSEMAQLWASLEPPPSSGQAKVILFAGARPGEGVSTVAREFAHYAKVRARGAVWLVDLDFAKATQYRAIAADPDRYGALGGQSAATPDGSTFFTIQPPSLAPDGHPLPPARYFVAHPVGAERFWVTRFRRESLMAGQRPRLTMTGDYWTALRRHAEWVVIDAPAGDQGEAVLATTPFADFTVLVVAADQADASGPAALRDAIVEAGGRCAGLVFNRVSLGSSPFRRGRSS